MRRPISFLLGAVAFLATSVAATVAMAPPASALTLLTCTGSASVDYSPGLTNTPQNVTASGQSSADCIGTVDLQPTHLQFTTSYTLQFVGSCNDLLMNGPSSQTIDWSTGETSEWEYDIVFSTVNGQVLFVATGQITDGKFDGAAMDATGTAVSDLDAFLTACQSPTGLTHSSQPATTLTLAGT